VYLQPETAQLFRDQLRGAVFLETELGMGVDVAPPAGHLLLQSSHGFDHGHIPVAPGMFIPGHSGTITGSAAD
jgi:hypothetical protein